MAASETLAKRDEPWPAPEPITQSGALDCGLACVTCILRSLAPDCFGSHEPEELLAKLTEKYNPDDNGLFSIEMAGPLLDCGFQGLHFFSTQLSVDTTYSDMSFYAGLNLQAEKERMEACTDALKRKGLLCTEQELTSDILAEQLGTGRLWCIVLVDLRYMPYAGLFLSLQPSYMGHFVVAYAYDFKTDTISIMDPSQSCNGLHQVTPAQLQAARDKRGTDHDVLCIPLPSAGSISTGGLA